MSDESSKRATVRESVAEVKHTVNGGRTRNTKPPCAKKGPSQSVAPALNTLRLKGRLRCPRSTCTKYICDLFSRALTLAATTQLFSLQTSIRHPVRPETSNLSCNRLLVSCESGQSVSQSVSRSCSLPAYRVIPAEATSHSQRMVTNSTRPRQELKIPGTGRSGVPNTFTVSRA